MSNTITRYAKSHLTQHRKGWKYVRHIPLAIRSLEGGKTAWTKYLGRIGYDTALKQARELDVHNDARIKRLETLTDDERREILSAPPIAKLSPIENWMRDVSLDKMDDALVRFIPDPSSAFQVAFHSEMSTEGEPAIKPSMEDAVEYLQLISELHEEVEARKPRRAARKLTLEKIEGMPSFRMSRLIKLWIDINKPRSLKSVNKAHLYVKRFVGVCGDLEPSQVTREHSANFRDVLDADDTLSHGTVNLHLEKLHALFNTALGDNKFGVNANPFTKIKSRKEKSQDDKQPFTTQQVRKILEACEPGSEFQLIFRLLAFHGARSSEICQLTCEDVTTLHGIRVLRIHGKNGSVKTRTRDVPIHPKCWSAIVRQRQKVMGLPKSTSLYAPDGSRWLFPESVCPRDGADRGHDFQLMGGRLLRADAKIRDKRLTIHSFRHLFRDLCREVEMPENISAAVMGHSLGRGDHGNTYGRGVSLKSRSQWLAKIDPLAG